MTQVCPTAYQETLMLNWGARDLWRTQGWIGLFGEEDSDNAYFYGDWEDMNLSPAYTFRQGTVAGEGVQVLLFRLGTSEFANWAGFRCNPSATVGDLEAPCTGIQVSRADMKTNFEGSSFDEATGIASDLFTAEMTWVGTAAPTTRFIKKIEDHELTSDTTFRFDYDHEVTMAYFNNVLAVNQWFIETVAIQGAMSSISAAAALLFASAAMLAF